MKKIILVWEKWFLSTVIYFGLLCSRRITKRGLIYYTYILQVVVKDKAYKKALKEAREKIKNGIIWADEVLMVLQKVNKKYFRLISNLIVNEIIWGINKRKAFEQQTGFYPPTFITISPTMRCNLNCVGCYANSYQKADLEAEIVEKVIREANEMGIYLFVISGGEPFLYSPLINIAKKHKNSIFHVFTNGSLLHPNRLLTRNGVLKEPKDLLLESGNIIPLFSIEGFEEETDNRRGKGTYRKITETMEYLNLNGIPFGFSFTHTRLNNHIFYSDRFIEEMIKRGAYLGWIFQYMPIDEDPNLELIPTPQQREKRYEVIRRWRTQYPIQVWDFWNDGGLVGGCIAASRYLHVNSNGDVEPCVFVHFKQEGYNVKEKSLIEILNSPLFKVIRSKQPYQDSDEKTPNLLRPCLIIDHPDLLRKIVNETKAVPTCVPSILEKEVEEIVDKYAQEWKERSAEIWQKDYSDYSKV